MPGRLIIPNTGGNPHACADVDGDDNFPVFQNGVRKFLHGVSRMRALVYRGARRGRVAVGETGLNNPPDP